MFLPRRHSSKKQLKIPGGGGNSAYEGGGEARRKFWIKTLKETDLGVAQAKETMLTDNVYIFIFFASSSKRDLHC